MLVKLKADQSGFIGVRHIGEEVSVGGGLLLEELAEEELAGRRRVSGDRDGHWRACEGFGRAIEEMGRNGRAMKREETDSKHLGLL